MITDLVLIDGDLLLKKEKEQIKKEIYRVRKYKKEIEAIAQSIKALKPNRERSLTITKLQEAIMWLESDLKDLNVTKYQLNKKTL